LPFLACKTWNFCIPCAAMVSGCFFLLIGALNTGKFSVPIETCARVKRGRGQGVKQ
jgi:hypothetical protein